MNRGKAFIVHRALLIALVALCCARSPVIPSHPTRVVSLAPNVTEVIFADGCGGKVVGTDDFSDYPEAVQHLPKVGGVEPDVEKIAALRPDLVLASASNAHPNLRRALAAARLPLLVVRTDRLADVAASEGVVGRALGCPQTASAVSSIRAALQAQRRTRAAAPRVLFVVWTDPLYVAGGATFIDDLFALAGARNAVSANGWPQESLETLAAHPPDLILYPNRSVTRAAIDDLLGRAHVRVESIAVDENVFARPGPRVALAAAEINRILDSWERSH